MIPKIEQAQTHPTHVLYIIFHDTNFQSRDQRRSFLDRIVSLPSVLVKSHHRDASFWRLQTTLELFQIVDHVQSPRPDYPPHFFIRKMISTSYSWLIRLSRSSRTERANSLDEGGDVNATSLCSSEYLVTGQWHHTLKLEASTWLNRMTLSSLHSPVEITVAMTIVTPFMAFRCKR